MRKDPLSDPFVPLIVPQEEARALRSFGAFIERQGAVDTRRAVHSSLFFPPPTFSLVELFSHFAIDLRPPSISPPASALRVARAGGTLVRQRLTHEASSLPSLFSSSFLGRAPALFLAPPRTLRAFATVDYLVYTVTSSFFSPPSRFLTKNPGSLSFCFQSLSTFGIGDGQPPRRRLCRFCFLPSLT